MPLSTIFQLYRNGQFTGEETRVPEENHQPAVSHKQNSSHNVVLYRVHLTMSGIRTHNISGDRY
jgi:hypothetical protein